MKKLYYAIGLLLIFSVILTCVLLTLSPDVIPAHYNAAGEIDRFGSKYEMLIWPGFAFLMTGIPLLLQRYQQRKNAPEQEQRILLGTSLFCLILFNALELFFGVAAIRYAPGSSLKPDSIIRLVSIGTGILLIILGNVMPKARRNSFFGLRTRWSMANDSIWRKCQRFGGISAVICGLLTVILAVVIPGIWNLYCIGAVILIWATVCTVASYRFWKTSQLKNT